MRPDFVVALEPFGRDLPDLVERVEQVSAQHFFAVGAVEAADFCVDALHEALRRYGTPEIFNTDQGSQFTSDDFTAGLKDAGVRISMDGKGRWVDNVCVERLWRSVKYEEVYLHAYASIAEANRRLAIYFDFYNRIRSHQSLDGMTPDAVYFGSDAMRVAA